MCEKYSRSLLRISVAQICQNLGWNSAQSSSLEVLTDVLERYILKIGGTCRKFSEQYGRTEANLNDLGLAFQHLGISISELEDYVHHVEPVPFAHEVVAFPAPKPSSLGFPNPRSREVLQHREEHIPEHMPYMFPNMKDEIPEDRTSSPVNAAVNGVDTHLKTELSQENGDKEDVNVGDKRAAPMSTPDLPPSKRSRLGNSNLPEEAGHSQYEMTCVFMGPNGVLTTRQGCQGRLPEPRLPPPNPRTLSEGANKENSGKTKDSGGPKISISVGGIGAEGLVSSKNESKKSKKSPQKKKMLQEHAAKTSSEETGKQPVKKSFGSKMSVDSIGKELGKKLVNKAVMDGIGKEIGKKSVSSKAAAKFLKKLKLSKKSSKLFTKSKVKDPKLAEIPKDDSSPQKPKKLVAPSNLDGKKKKEKKSAEFVDSDEELRNLLSPSSSRVPSPEQPIITNAEGGAQIKARLEAIDDSINAVLRDGPPKEGKIKKRKKKEKVDGAAVNRDSAVKVQSEGKTQEPKIKRKPGRPPKVQKPPELPTPVDVKPFVSDRYSSEELQIYEFNDSPPDTSISSRRPSAAETVATATPPPPPPPPQPTIKHEQAVPTTKHATTSSSSSHKFHRRVEIEDDLFAPEIKIESRVDHSDQSLKPFKLELSKDREKLKIKEEKKERGEEEKVLQKSRDEKGDRQKDKKEKHKEEKERSRDDKDKHKEKEHKKDKKEKKKDKEKKKRHKFKDFDRDKEKDKKQEEKVKQESRESRESSPAVGVGVKLKIKIGGGAGTPTSMMVTGESNSPASPASTHGSKRESMSPPRVVPKLYILKKGQAAEEKSKKASKPSHHGEGSKHKSSPLAKSIKSQSSPSSRKASPSPRSTPTPPIPRKTPTPPPPPKSANKGLHSPHGKSSSNKQKDSVSLVPAKERPSRSPIKDRSNKSDRKKKERKPSLSSLSSTSSNSSPSPVKSSLPRRQTPPRLERMSSSSPEKSPPSLPFQSPIPSPRTSLSAARSPSHASSPHHSPTPPPSLSRRKPTPPPALSPSHSPRQHSHSPSLTRPPTPGSTSPPPSPDWNLPVSSPSHPRSPTPTPRTPTASPSRIIPSPSHSPPPGSPEVSHRSPSPAVHSSSSRPGSRLLETPEPKSHSKDNPSPASSGKSSTSTSKQARTVEAETVCVFYDDSGQKVWICPACKLPDDGSEMIGCDMCDNWYHWPCVGITEAPPEEQQWFCSKCLPKTKSSVRGRGRPRGRGRGRGRKKIT